MTQQAARNGTEARITRAALARALNLSRAAITRAARAGRIAVGPDGLVNAAEAASAFAAAELATVEATTAGNGHATEMAGLRKQFLQARISEIQTRAAIAELELKQKAGELIEVAEHIRALSAYAHVAKTHFWAWQGKLPPILAEREPIEIAEVLQQETRDALDSAVSTFPAKVRRACAWLDEHAPDLSALPPEAGRHD